MFKYILDSLLKYKGQMRIQSETPVNVQKLINKLHPVKIKLIRIGPTGDGGYLVPDDLNNLEACFSPGVYEITKFEYDCHDRGMKLFLADKSISKPEINIPSDRYEFLQKFIGPTENDDFITLDSWVRNSKTNVDSDLMLQMDIEGWEYLAIVSTSSEVLSRFRIIVIEFHNLDKLWNPFFFNLANQAFSKLLETHVCVHNHPNNDCEIFVFNGIEIPPLSEMTFYRRDKIMSNEYEDTFPNDSDHVNFNEKKRVVLPKNWYRSGVL